MHASFHETLTNCISEESLLNVLYVIYNFIEFFFQQASGAGKHEMSKGRTFIEFIGYRMSQHKQNGCTVLFTRHQSTKSCQAFASFWSFQKGVFLFFLHGNGSFLVSLGLFASFSQCKVTFLFWIFDLGGSSKGLYLQILSSSQCKQYRITQNRSSKMSVCCENFPQWFHPFPWLWHLGLL